MRLRWIKLLVVSACTYGASGCASVYIHDAQLAERAEAARTAVDAADFLAPYDQRIAELAALSAREDSAAIALHVAYRDAQLALMADSNASDRRGIAGDELGRSWLRVMGADASPVAMSTFRDRVDQMHQADVRARASRQAANLQMVELGHRYRDDVRLAQTTAQSLQCDNLIGLSDQVVNEDPGAVHLRGMRTLCGEISRLDQRDAFAPLLADGAVRAGSLLTALEHLVAARARVAPDRAAEGVTAYERALQAELRRAEEAGQSTAAARGLAFEAALTAHLDQASAFGEFIGWSRMESELDRIGRAMTCRAPAGAASADELKAANCAALGDVTTEAKTSVLLSFAAAIAQVEDANDEAIRSGRWLEAARAVIAARKEAARLRLARDRSVLASAEQRVRALVLEADAAARGLLALRGERGLCTSPATACAIQAYVDGSDKGAAPAAALEMREIQADRLLNAQLARLAAQTDAALLRAAAGQLDEYAKGGFEPAVIAQVVYDLGLLGLVASD